MCTYTFSITKCITEHDVSSMLDKMYTAYFDHDFDYVLVIGDLNYETNWSFIIYHLSDTFNLTNVINEHTCYMKICGSTLINVILTNSHTLNL